MANNVSRTDVVAEARTWLGTPFKHQGCLKGVACDCIGLIKGVGLALCLADYDPDGPEATAYASYSMNPNSRRMRAGLATWLVPISVADATVADGAASRSKSHSSPIKASFTAIPVSARLSNTRWMKAGDGGSLPLIVSRTLSRIHKWPFLLLVSLAQV